MEIWKDVIGYEGIYRVSSYGNVKRFKANRWCSVKPWLDGRGYYRVSLSRNGIRHVGSVHRMVAFSFIENPNNYPEVNHIDENKKNNNLTNLEWVTSKMNANHGTRIKRISSTNNHQGLIYIMVDESGEIIRTFDTTRELREKGFNPANIRTSIKKGWKSMGYYWQTKRIK